jgi:hypothetical protein
MAETLLCECEWLHLLCYSSSNLRQAEHEVEMHRYLCEDVMITELQCLPELVNLGDVVRLLRRVGFNGFPVVEEEPDNGGRSPNRRPLSPASFSGNSGDGEWCFISIQTTVTHTHTHTHTHI